MRAIQWMQAGTAALGVLGTVLPAPAQTFMSPQHDIRVVIALDMPKQELMQFYNVQYGDTIRLGEFGCGDPRFLVTVNETPRFNASGLLKPDGSYGTMLHLFTGLNAKIYETCFGFNQPSVGG